MEKSKYVETSSTASEFSDKTFNSSKNQPIIDFSNLKMELTELNQEGNSLIKQSKLEEARNKYLKGQEKFENVADKIYNLFTNNDQIDQILSLYKHFLSKIAESFYEQKKYKDAIVYDLKLICLDPKNGGAIFRLFHSYSNIGKTQQAIYYGELFLELDNDKQNIFKNAKDVIENEKLKLIKIQKYRKNRIISILIMIIIFVSILSLYKNRKN